MAEDITQGTSERISDMEFDVARTFSVLTATLVLPMYLAFSVTAFSLGALI